MAVESFKRVFEEANHNSKIFSFGILRNNLNLISPKKEKCSTTYQMDNVNIFINSKESIIRNLCLHPILIQKPNFNVSFLKDLYDLMQDMSYSESKLAQCLYLLHASKSDFSSLDLTSALIEFNNIFLNFNSIETYVDYQEFSFLKDLEYIFEKILNCLNITKIIDNLVDEILSKQKTFDYNKVRLVFFKSRIIDLDGYSGKDTVYVNTEPLVYFYQLNIDQEIKEITLKLNFISLVIHELSHIVLRFKLNDLNLSSPFLTDINDDDIKRKNVDECGYEVEKRFFKHIINWPASACYLDLDYCRQYLEKLLKDEFVEIDIEKGRLLTIHNERLPKMALSYNLRRHFFHF